MNLFTIAKKNLKKNFSMYSLYLFSTSFIIMVFFSFVTFSNNEVILRRISRDGRVETMSKAILIFLMCFVIFYMSYSNSFFIKRRVKELAIYALLGFKKTSMIVLLFFENLLICLSSLIIGIFLGCFLHRGFVILIIHLLGLKVDLSRMDFISVKAIIFTSLFVIFIIFALFISNFLFLKKNSLLSLVHVDKKSENEVKPKIWKATLGFITLICGYALAFNITLGKTSLWITIGFAPMATLTLLFVVLGTILFINSFLPYAILKLKKHKKNFYRQINIIVIPKFVYRIRTNSKTLITSTLISAVTLTVLGVTLITIYFPFKSLDRVIPAAFEFPMDNTQKTNTAINLVRKEVGEKNFFYKKTSLIKVTSSSKNLPYEYRLNKPNGFELISVKDYKELMKFQNKKSSLENLTKNNCVLVKYQQDKTDDFKGKIFELNLNQSNTLKVNVITSTLNNPIGFNNSIGTLIISDDLYNKIEKLNLQHNKVISIFGKNMKTNKLLYEKLAPIFKDNPRFQSAYQRLNEYITENSSTLLLITFVTAIFFIATGSLLYFSSLSGIYYDKSDFNILKKIGYKNKKLKKIIRNQTLVLFIIPYILGTIHSLFALECFKPLMPNLIGNTNIYWIPELGSIGIYTIIYIVYYIITNRVCCNMVLKENM